MVGHTGNIEATVKAVEAVDECIGEIFKQCKKNGFSKWCRTAKTWMLNNFN